MMAGLFSGWASHGEVCAIPQLVLSVGEEGGMKFT